MPSRRRDLSDDAPTAPRTGGGGSGADAGGLLGRLAALGDPIRLRALRLLEAEELTVGELARVLQLPQSTVSRHLKVLASGGWVGKRSEGTSGLYRLVLDDLTVPARELWLAVRGQAEGGGVPELRDDEARLAAVLAERRTDSESYFGRVGGSWDAVRAQLFGDRFTARGLLGLVPAGWTIADIGCGTGQAAELLAPFAEKVVAIDASGAMLEAARARLSGVRGVRFAEGRVEKLPLADASVDAAVCALVLHHVEEPAAAWAELRRVLRAGRGGGVALVIDMLAHERREYRQAMGHKHLGFSAGEVERAARAAGFASCRVTELAPEPEVRGPRLFAAAARIE